MANTVYDPEDEVKKSKRPADGFDDIIENNFTPDELREMEDSAHNGAAEDILNKDHQGAEKSIGTGDTTESGEAADLQKASGDTESQTKDFFNPSGGKSKGLLKGLTKKKRSKWLIVGGVSGGGAIVIVILIMLFLSSLKLQQLTEHIVVYNFARTARTFRQSSSEIMAEKYAADEAESGLLKKIANKFNYTKDTIHGETWGRFDKFRPKKVFENMHSTDQLDFVTETKKNFLGMDREVLTGIKVGGEEIPFSTSTSSKWYQYFEKRSDRLKFNARLQANLETSLSETNTLVRGAVAKRIRSKLGIKLRRWERLSPTYRNAKAAEAERLAAKESLARSKPSNKPSSVVNGVSEAADDVTEAVSECFDDQSCYDKAKTGKTFPAAADSAATNAFKDGLSQVTSSFSTAYGIALPLCLIYDGSVENSSGVVNANSEQSVKNYYTIMTARDQQRSGEDVDATAIGGTADMVGQIENTAPELRANGITPVTDNFVSAQSAGSSEYTIFGTFLSGPLKEFFDKVAGSGCPVVTHPFTGGVLALAEGALAVTGAGGAAKVPLTKFVTGFVRNFVSKRTLTKIAAETVAIAGVTYLAKMAVLQHAGSANQTLPIGEDFVASADQGASIHAGDINRQQFYARPLSKSELIQSNEQNQNDIAFANSQKPFSERYFDIHNADSLVAKTGFAFSTKLGTSLSGSIQKLLTSVGSVLRPSSASFLTAFPGQTRALAATSDDYYKIIQWDWTLEEQNAIDSRPDLYSPLNNAFYWENEVTQPQKDEIISDYDKCFTKEIGSLLADKDIERDEEGYVKPDKGDCAPDKLKYSPNNDLIFRYRLYMRYNSTLDHLLGIQEPQETSESTGNANIYVVGDSLTVGMDSSGGLKEKLTSNGWNVTKVLATEGDSVDSALPKMDADSTTIANSGTVVIALGTNPAPDSSESAFNDKVKLMINKIKSFNPNANIFWVNVYTKLSEYPGTNNALDNDQASQGYDVIDWRTEAKQNVAKYPFESDGIHHTVEGFKNKAQFLADELGQAPKSDGDINVKILAGDTSNLSCGAGTDAGVVDGYKGGKRYKIRLCNVQGTQINSQIAVNVDNLLTSAKSAGLGIKGDGFRSMEGQIAVRGKNGCPDIYNSPSSSCRVPTARPGYSNHQMGLAIDFYCSGAILTSSSACFTWLSNNASKYGLQNFPKEAWHWSVDGR